jgi:hypothetical protein
LVGYSVEIVAEGAVANVRRGVEELQNLLSPNEAAGAKGALWFLLGHFAKCIAQAGCVILGECARWTLRLNLLGLDGEAP